ncbi:hypothetical protein [Cryobacterium sp. PH31-O1]|uniref:hypothetical protein n=1 Tax=Cryobacterium sp. PH31-O1 TaxID=3046306 RepID=UPI0024BAE8F7|nr:hypothetical protein [Cryobacterium sp. PH31-O1]MDJ0337428.1 hypothetical protein [Cryobacterium sp. PH31-O1]
MSKEVTQYEAAGLDEKMRYVQTLASAGDLIPKGLWDRGAPSPGKVLLVMETGAMLGIHPMAALGGIHVIEGKPTISPGLMSGLVRKAGHKLRVNTTGTIEGGDFAATATITRSDDPDFTYSATWTPARAARAGLCKYEVNNGKWVVTARSKSGNPLPWEAYSEGLCKARAIGEVVREGGEDVLMGVSYTPEEMGALVTDAGELQSTTGTDAEPAEDWAALVAAATTTAELMAIRDRASAAEQYTANRTMFLTKHGELSRAEASEASEASADTAAEPDENIVDAEIITDDEPVAAVAELEPEETELQRYERETAAEFAAATPAAAS